MNNVKKLAYTALLLAVCVTFQLLKSFSVYITGPAVNAVLIIAATAVGLPSGLFIACVAPLIAYLVGATPIINMIPVMLPVIMVGNALIAVFAYLFKEKNLIAGLLAGSVAKAGFLWLTVWYVVLPLFGANVPEKVQLAAKNTFSITQLITALIGSAIAYIIYKRLFVKK